MYVYYFHMYVYISVCSIIFHQAISWINVILRGFTLIYMQYRWNNLMFCSNRIHLTSCTLLNKDTVDKLPVRDTITELGNFVELLSLQEVSVIFYPHMHFHIQVWFTIPWDTESPSPRNSGDEARIRECLAGIPHRRQDWNLIKNHQTAADS